MKSNQIKHYKHAQSVCNTTPKPKVLKHAQIISYLTKYIIAYKQGRPYNTSFK